MDILRNLSSKEFVPYRIKRKARMSSRILYFLPLIALNPFLAKLATRPSHRKSIHTWLRYMTRISRTPVPAICDIRVNPILSHHSRKYMFKPVKAMPTSMGFPSRKLSPLALFLTGILSRTL